MGYIGSVGVKGWCVADLALPQVRIAVDQSTWISMERATVSELMTVVSLREAIEVNYAVGGAGSVEE